MKSDTARPGRLLGSLLLSCGLAWNAWSIGFVLAPDQFIEDPDKILKIRLLQAGVVVVGLLLVLRPRLLPLPALLRQAAAAALALATLGGLVATAAGLEWIDIGGNKEFNSAVARMVRAEDLHLAMMGKLKPLDDSVANFELPDYQGVEMFEQRVLFNDLVAGAAG